MGLVQHDLAWRNFIDEKYDNLKQELNYYNT